MRKFENSRIQVLLHTKRQLKNTQFIGNRENYKLASALVNMLIRRRCYENLQSIKNVKLIRVLKHRALHSWLLYSYLSFLGTT